MSAIDKLRDIVAIHSGSEVIAWPRASLVAVLQEIDELSEFGLDWAKRAAEAQQEVMEWRAGRAYVGQPVELTEEWTMDDVIAVTPAQLVQIIREAGKS